jgi:trans-aconitate methyltransferase
VPETGCVLDLGCGIGRLTIPVAQARPQATVFGLDVSDAMLDRARLTRPLPQNVLFVKGDGVRLPELPPLAAAFSVTVFQHLPEEVVEMYISQVALKLVPGGVFFFQFVDGDYSGFLSHAIPIERVAAMCDDSNFSRVDVLRGGQGLPPHTADESWVWVTARR